VKATILQHVTARIVVDNRLNLRDIRLLLTLCTLSDTSLAVNHVSRKQLGQLAGNMGEDVVSRISGRLQKLGWITKSGDGGRSQAASYRLTIPQQFHHQIN
jgi:hypothetical protein